MNFVCEFCNATFNKKSSLTNHHKNARYCLIKRGKIVLEKVEETFYNCKYCKKVMVSKQSLNNHLQTCIDKHEFLYKEKEEENEALKTTNKILEIDNIKLQEEISKLKDELKTLHEQNLKKLQDENKDNKKKIESMTKKYVKRQERVQYEVPNVIYVLTTESLKKERRYILGKAGNLTDRLSTYNKTDEHQVVYYQGCVDLESMALVESLVFKRLKEYRERANRERFILPEDKEIDIFIDAINKSIEFVRGK
jgi:hypothetical protein